MVRTNKNGIKIYGEEDFAGMRKAAMAAGLIDEKGMPIGLKKGRGCR